MEIPFSDKDINIFESVKFFLKNKFDWIVHDNLFLSEYHPVCSGGVIAELIHYAHNSSPNYNLVKNFDVIIENFPESHRPDYDIFFNNFDPSYIGGKVLPKNVLGNMKNRGSVSFIENELKFHDLNYMGNKNVVSVATYASTNTQFIFNNYKNPQEMVKEFDFFHLTPYYNIFTNKLHISRKVYDIILRKDLVLQNKKHTYDKRRKKFINRGWKEPIEIILVDTTPNKPHPYSTFTDVMDEPNTTVN